jgi:acetyl esterase/lipase
LPFGFVAVATAVLQRPGLGGPLPMNAQRRWLEFAARSLPEPAGTIVRGVDLGGRAGLRVTVGATERPHAIVHLHGGAYTVGSPRTHRSLAAFLARASGAAVYLPDYRLAPEYPFPAALEDAVDACGDVAAAHDRFAISGDSAGGGLAIATTRRLVDDGQPSPVAMALISPWVDPTEPSLRRKRDLVVRESWGLACAAAYIGESDPRNPGIAPRHGDLTGLPPALIQVGRREVLYSQITRFIGELRVAGCDVTVTELKRLWHVGHAQAGLLIEARDAVDELGWYLRKQLDIP